MKINEYLWWTSPAKVTGDDPAVVTMAHIKWLASSTNYFMFNVDGSYNENPNLAGVGGVLRDHNGVMKAIFSGPVAASEVSLVELSTACRALELVLASPPCGHHALIDESDSQNVISWLNERNSKPWRYWRTIEEIEDFCSKAQVVHFANIFREAYTVADSLAKLRARRNDPFYAWM